MTIAAGIEFPFQSGVVLGNITDFPWFNSYCGDIDLIGNKKPQSYYRDLVWDRSKIEMAENHYDRRVDCPLCCR